METLILDSEILDANIINTLQKSSTKIYLSRKYQTQYYNWSLNEGSPNVKLISEHMINEWLKEYKHINSDDQLTSN